MNKNGYGDNKKNSKPFRKSSNKPEMDQKRAAILEKQKVTLDILENAMRYSDQLTAENPIKDGKFTKVKIRDLIDYLNQSCNPDDSKSLAKFNYILVDLINARRNKNIPDARTDIRILYLKEILESSFDRSYYDRIWKIMDDCKYLLNGYCFSPEAIEAAQKALEEENNDVKNIINEVVDEVAEEASESEE